MKVLQKRTNSPYLLEFDLMRLLLIMGVLFTHTETTMGNATDPSSWSRMVFSYSHLMLHFTRMGFVFITGFVLTWNYSRRRFNWLNFWQKRYVRIGIPYVFWITVYLAGIMLIKTSRINSANYFHNWLSTILNGSQFYMYYLVLAALLYLIFPIFIWVYDRLAKYNALILIASFVLQMMLVYIAKYVSLAANVHPMLSVIYYHYGNDPLLYQLYFIMGATIAYHYKTLVPLIDHFKKSITLVAVLLSFSTIGLYWFNIHVLRFSHHKSESIHQPLVMLMDVMMITALFALSHWLVPRVKYLNQIHFSGQMTFGIYLTQTIFLTGLAGLLRLTDWPSWVYLVTMPLAFALVFSVAYGFVAILSKGRLTRLLVGLKLENKNKMKKSY